MNKHYPHELEPVDQFIDRYNGYWGKATAHPALMALGHVEHVFRQQRALTVAMAIEIELILNFEASVGEDKAPLALRLQNLNQILGIV